MKYPSTKQTIWIVGVLTSVMGLSGLAFAHPPAAVPPFAEEILDRLDQLEAKIDSQSTDLRGVTQNWDKKLDSTNGDLNGCHSERFTCLFGDTAVRDNETGLVWEASPDITGGPNFDGQRTWSVANTHCTDLEVDDRKGWALPTKEQLGSLVDTTGTGDDGNGNPVKLSDGHPFSDVQSAIYWTATSKLRLPDGAWGVRFSDGRTFIHPNKGNLNHVWCVRGGQSYDGQDVQDVIDELP